MSVDALKALWRDASALKRGLLVGVPVLVIALAGVAIGLAFAGGGTSSKASAIAPAEAAPTSTEVPATATSLPLPTETPASAGLQASTAPPPGNGGGTGGAGGASSQPRQPQEGSGPGSPTGTGVSVQIPSIGVNAPAYGRSVGTNGQMGNPSGPWDLVWYDFSENWPGLGGFPGEKGANAVFAGHVDYIHVGPAVFWSVRDLQPGDQVIVNTPNGPITYAIQWSQWAGPEDDFTPFVQRTGQDAITLVTCIGGFSAGHYSNRLIVRGVRI